MLKQRTADENPSVTPVRPMASVPGSVPRSESDIPQMRPEEFRVRPDELADALTVLAETTGKTVGGTLPLDRTLKEMDRAALADEVWAEVQARRRTPQARATASVRPRSKNARRQLAFGFLATFALFAVTIFFGILLNQPASLGFKDALPGAVYTLTAIGEWTGISGEGSEPIPFSSNEDFRSFPRQSPTMKPLSEVGEGEVVSVDESQAKRLQELENRTIGKSATDRKALLARTFVEMKPGPADLQTVRFGHQWYRRGWTTEKPVTIGGRTWVPFTAQPTDRLIFHWPRTDGKFPQGDHALGNARKPIQVPISLAGDSEYLNVRHVSGSTRTFSVWTGVVDPSRLDGRAWDPWTPATGASGPERPSAGP
ncbi:MAG: hypothetical protein SFU56_16410 [Capsulimonadales bacterium]|nr:hypothetical protein [Capsulimonadales bacterium]